MHPTSSKIYESLQKDWQAYQHAKNIINRIKVHANNGNFQSVAIFLLLFLLVCGMHFSTGK